MWLHIYRPSLQEPYIYDIMSIGRHCTSCIAVHMWHHIYRLDYNYFGWEWESNDTFLWRLSLLYLSIKSRKLFFASTSQRRRRPRRHQQWKLLLQMRYWTGKHPLRTYLPTTKMRTRIAASGFEIYLQLNECNLNDKSKTQSGVCPNKD